MAKAKAGEFWIHNPQRAMANNSVAYTEKPSARKFLSEWMKLVESGTGERGIFNRVAVVKKAAETGRRKTVGIEFVVNPCGETILRPNGLCNLTTVVVRPDDSLETLKDKVKHATILGMVQSTLTNFNFVNAEFKRNAEEERLLGVSLTGLRDHYVLYSVSPQAEEWLTSMKAVAVETAWEWHKILGINMPTAITTVKPEGTVSQLTNTSSGIHPRYAPYYIRRVRVSAMDPLVQLLTNSGMTWKPEVGQDPIRPSVVVFEFPVASPSESIINAQVTALNQLNYWQMLKNCWCEHTPSCTIYVQEHEWVDVGAWVYRNWDDICGLSFLPADGGIYQLAPYEEISKEEYQRMVKVMPQIDFGKLHLFEKVDNTEGSVTLACTGGGCDI